MSRSLIVLLAASGLVLAATARDDNALIPGDLAQLRVVTGLPAGTVMGLWAKPGETDGQPTGWSFSGDRIFLTGQEVVIGGEVWVQTDYQPTFRDRSEIPWVLKSYLAPYVPAPAALTLPLSCQYWEGNDDLKYSIGPHAIQIDHLQHEEMHEGDWTESYEVAAGAEEVSPGVWSMAAVGKDARFIARLRDTQVCRTATGLQPQRYEYEDTRGAHMCCDPGAG
ncbi:hypothetical protein sos41_30770 [Alphaproteobacteria bacterium SO-S41]|nr:hypothetical protein sos41_30770 [Alphaproteobacteria bacterium SO-S41]